MSFISLSMQLWNSIRRIIGFSPEDNFKSFPPSFFFCLQKYFLGYPFCRRPLTSPVPNEILRNNLIARVQCEDGATTTVGWKIIACISVPTSIRWQVLFSPSKQRARHHSLSSTSQSYGDRSVVAPLVVSSSSRGLNTTLQQQQQRLNESDRIDNENDFCSFVVVSWDQFL